MNGDGVKSLDDVVAMFCETTAVFKVIDADNNGVFDNNDLLLLAANNRSQAVLAALDNQSKQLFALTVRTGLSAAGTLVLSGYLIYNRHTDLQRPHFVFLLFLAVLASIYLLVIVSLDVD